MVKKETTKPKAPKAPKAPKKVLAVPHIDCDFRTFLIKRLEAALLEAAKEGHYPDEVDVKEVVNVAVERFGLGDR